MCLVFGCKNPACILIQVKEDSERGALVKVDQNETDVVGRESSNLGSRAIFKLFNKSLDSDIMDVFRTSTPLKGVSVPFRKSDAPMVSSDISDTLGAV